MLTYKEVQEEAVRRYPDNIWNRIAFTNGALYFMRQVCPEKEKEMEISYATQD